MQSLRLTLLALMLYSFLSLSDRIRTKKTDASLDKQLKLKLEEFINQSSLLELGMAGVLILIPICILVYILRPVIMILTIAGATIGILYLIFCVLPKSEMTFSRFWNFRT